MAWSPAESDILGVPCAESVLPQFTQDCFPYQKRLSMPAERVVSPVLWVGYWTGPPRGRLRVWRVVFMLAEYDFENRPATQRCQNRAN